MPSYPRGQIVSTDQVGVYHCITRCVRRAFLCGVDPVSGRDYQHRKGWIRQRLEQLAATFAIEICGYAVMSNHLHLVLRTRPDLVPSWSPQDIALRWLALFPPRDPETGNPVEPAPCDIDRIVSNPEQLAEIRDRLASLSWFMRSLSEPIARRADRDDRCTGRFWEGRFKAQALLDEAATLACSVYVDLNPIRAGIAQTPEESECTSAFDRIRSLAMMSPPTGDLTLTDPAQVAIAGPEGAPLPAEQQPRSDSWLCELTLAGGPNEAPRASCVPTVPLPEQRAGEAAKSEHGMRTCRSCRASDQGYLPMGLDR